MSNRQDAKSAKRCELFDAQDTIDQQREDLIEKIEKQLKQNHDVKPCSQFDGTSCKLHFMKETHL